MTSGTPSDRTSTTSCRLAPAKNGTCTESPTRSRAAGGSVGNTQRRYFTGPWQWRWNASVKKGFRYRERYQLDFHFDFFNWMNHPTFYVFPSDGGDYGSTTNFNINNTTFGKITGMNF